MCGSDVFTSCRDSDSRCSPRGPVSLKRLYTALAIGGCRICLSAGPKAGVCAFAVVLWARGTRPSNMSQMSGNIDRVGKYCIEPAVSVIAGLLHPALSPLHRSQATNIGNHFDPNLTSALVN
jgi:hypothetical protein